jgi:hypothetical protein
LIQIGNPSSIPYFAPAGANSFDVVLRRENRFLSLVTYIYIESDASFIGGYLIRRKKRYIFAALNGPIVQWIE